MSERRLGDILRERRESLNLTIKDVADMTKLKKSTILALEEGNYKELQEPVYIRGFLKIYASVLNLDYEELYPLLDRELRMAGKISEEEIPRKKSWAFLVGIVIVIAILAFYCIFSWLSRLGSLKGKTEMTTPVTQPVQVKPESGFEKPKVEEKTITQESVPPVKREVSVEIKGLGYSWLRVIVDDKKVFEGFINTGDSYSWKGERKIVVRVGNAGAVRIILNNRDLGVLGKKGEVLEREFLPE